jgi:class 3 adenylate cyclase
MFKEFGEDNSTQFDLDRSLYLLSELEMEAEDIETISIFLQHDKSDSLGNIPDYEKLEKALAKLDLNMNLPDPNLEGSYNPMCSMSDLILFGQNKKIIKDSISDLENNLLPILKTSNHKIREYFYEFCGDENASKLWEEFQGTEEEMQRTKLLSDLVSFERNYANARVFENNVSSPKDITAMDLAMKSNNAKINSLTVEFDAKKDIIGNLKDSVSGQPDNPIIKQFLNNAITEKNEISEKISLILLENLSLTKSMYGKYSDVLTRNKAEIRQFDKFFANFHDSIVLIGPEERTFMDLAPTPMDNEPIPKVSVHGNVIKTLSSGIFIKRMFDTKEASSLLIFMLCLVSAALSSHSSSWTSWVGILVLAGFVLLGVFLFSSHHIVIPLATPALAGLNTYVFGLAAMVVIEQKAKGKLKGMFGSYVSSDLVEQMVESGEEPKLGGEETAITAFFSDVQAFSSFSELLTPTGLVDLMNEYLTEMTNILQEERGTLDKYIGDAIVAMYGAPIPMEDHAYQAVRTAILMQQKQIQLREKWVPEVEKWGKCHGLVTQMQTRIGCNTGTATVGNMGALDRFNYTMMGDMVNLAARCESGAKAYGAYIMVTEETKIASSAKKDDIAFRYLDKIVVKGRSQPVAMFEPTGFMNELTQETQDCLDCFQQGIDKYLLQDWGGALDLFAKAKEMEPNKPGVTPGVKDNPSMILIDRCKVMQENPPGDDWDGVYIMTTK